MKQDKEEQKIIIDRMLQQRGQRKIRQQPRFESGLKESHSTDDSDCSHDYSEAPVKHFRSNPRKEKLELCKKFMQSGFCPYYSRCKFAHGSHELRKNNEVNFRYKTKECGTFFLEGHCHYGNRCNFLHQSKSQSHPTPTTQTLIKLQNFGIDFLKITTQRHAQSRLNQLIDLIISPIEIHI